MNSPRSGVRPRFARSRHGVLTAVCRPGGSPAGPWRQVRSTHCACSYDCARRSIDALVSRHNLEIARPGFVIGSPTEPPCASELLLSLFKHSLARTQCPCPRQWHMPLLLRHVPEAVSTSSIPRSKGTPTQYPRHRKRDARLLPSFPVSDLNTVAPAFVPVQSAPYVPRSCHVGTRRWASRWGKPPNVREEGLCRPYAPPSVVQDRRAVAPAVTPDCASCGRSRWATVMGPLACDGPLLPAALPSLLLRTRTWRLLGKYDDAPNGGALRQPPPLLVALGPGWRASRGAGALALRRAASATCASSHAQDVHLCARAAGARGRRRSGAREPAPECSQAWWHPSRPASRTIAFMAIAHQTLRYSCRFSRIYFTERS